MREHFLLDPSVVFLNHGSFGACPIPVFEEYQRWQRELERQPVEFLGRRADMLLDTARTRLSTYLNCESDDLIFVPNATVGVNTVARSLKLEPDDEILTTNHEYGACDKTWRFVARKTGAKYVRHPVQLPFDPEAMVESIWNAVTPRTKVLYLSHITSPTALIFPIEELIRRAREAGIFTLIDGAHAPGQIPLDLTALGADAYTGNLHKWLCAPKGAGFLHVRREHHAAIEPLVISWGYPDGDDPTGASWGYGTDVSFVTQNQWQGTRDIAAFLSVPAAIDFQQAYDWDSVRQRCYELVVETRHRLCELTGLPPIAPENSLGQMFTAALPPCDVFALKTRLYDEYRVEVPAIVWNDQPFIRASFQGYNTRDDADALLSALAILLS
jgi:isopenicillin-N epimerase